MLDRNKGERKEQIKPHTPWGGELVYVHVKITLGVENLNLERKAVAQLHIPSSYRKCENTSTTQIDWGTLILLA